MKSLIKHYTVNFVVLFIRVNQSHHLQIQNIEVMTERTRIFMLYVHLLASCMVLKTILSCCIRSIVSNI